MAFRLETVDDGSNNDTTTIQSTTSQEEKDTPTNVALALLLSYMTIITSFEKFCELCLLGSPALVTTFCRGEFLEGSGGLKASGLKAPWPPRTLESRKLGRSSSIYNLVGFHCETRAPKNS